MLHFLRKINKDVFSKKVKMVYKFIKKDTRQSSENKIDTSKDVIINIFTKHLHDKLLYHFDIFTKNIFYLFSQKDLTLYPQSGFRLATDETTIGTAYWCPQYAKSMNRSIKCGLLFCSSSLRKSTGNDPKKILLGFQ